MPLIILPLLSALWSRIWTFLLFLTPWIIEKIVKLLGVAVVTYTGIQIVFTQVENYVFEKLDGLPSDVYSLIVLADLDWAVATIFAWAAALYVMRPATRITVGGK